MSQRQGEYVPQALGVSTRIGESRVVDAARVAAGARPRPALLPEPPAEELFCPIISVDDHMMEPKDLFEKRVTGALADQMPRYTVNSDGTGYWEFSGKFHAYSRGDGQAGFKKSDWNGPPPNGFDDFRRGIWDSKARLHDMDLGGVWAQLGFPSGLWGFAGSAFSKMDDEKVGVRALQAYNDWVIDEWCAADPDRYIPCQLTYLRNPLRAAEEVRRNAERGFKAVTFSENPELLGWGSIHRPYWDPFFQACEETGTVINLHVGSSGQTMQPSADSPHEVTSALFPLNGIMAVIDWIYAKVPIRFPNIKVVLSEGGASWVPMAAERLRRSFRGFEVTKIWERTDPAPEELLFRNFWFTSIEDPSAFEMLDKIGPTRLMVETDYPHSDSTWPNCQAMIRSEMQGLSREDVERVCFRNAAAVYEHPALPSEEWIDKVRSMSREGSSRVPA